MEQIKLIKWLEYNNAQAKLLITRANSIISAADPKKLEPHKSVFGEVRDYQTKMNNPDYILEILKHGCIHQEFHIINDKLQAVWKAVGISGKSPFSDDDDKKAIAEDGEKTNWKWHINTKVRKFKDASIQNKLYASILHTVIKPSPKDTTAFGKIRVIPLFKIEDLVPIKFGNGNSTIITNVYKGKFESKEVSVTFYQESDAYFEKEVLLLKELSSDNYILPLLGAEKTPGCRILVSSFIQIGDLDTIFISKDLKVSPQQRLFIALQLAKALQFLHAKQLLFLYLSHSNILIDASYGVKLTKLSQCVKFNDPLPNPPADGAVYAVAPEVEEKKPQKISVKSDIFSFGIILWELFVQKLYLEKRKHSQPSFGSVENTPVGNLIKNCWTAEPSARPDIAQIIAVLETEVKNAHQ